MDFKEIFENTSEQIKLKFFDAIIKHNKKLQEEFVNFSNQNDKNNEQMSFKSFLKKIAETQEQYLEEFKNIDLENPDWDNYNPPHSSYIEEWEQYQQASEQEFEQVFEYFKSKAIDIIIQQQIDDLIANLLGLYKVCLKVEIEDEVGSFDDVNEFLTDEHKRIMLDIIDKIKMSAVSSHKVNPAIKLFFDYCSAEYTGNQSYPKYFEPLILALADFSDQPNKILSYIDASKVDREAMPQLVLLLNKNAGNKTDWLQSAQQYFLKDNEVAKQLLDYYFENDKNSFIKTAYELFDIDKQYWSRFLQNKVDPQLAKSLYFKVFYQLTISEEKIEYYHKIKADLSPSDFSRLISEINWNKVFIVKILEVEQKFEDIKQIVEKNKNDWKFEELIKPILRVFPVFCFNTIKSKTENTLANERGRSTYQRIVSCLQLAKDIPGYEAKTKELIRELYNYKPNLPALKDEMRMGGLV